MRELLLASELDLLYPLSEFYEQSGLLLPHVLCLADQEVPDPYRRLLVHDRDMTPTLEAAYGRKMHLRVLSYTQQGNIFSRHIVLVPEGGADPVLFAAIKIYLDYFPAPAREMVIARVLPFGTILADQKIEHFSRPDAYLQIMADGAINRALGLSGSARFVRPAQCL
jgi:hypothetical protein